MLHLQVHNEFILKSERDSFISRIRDIIHRVETLLRKDGRSGTELPKGPEAGSAVGSPVSASLALPVLGKLLLLLLLSMAWDAAWPQGIQGGGGWGASSCGHLPAPVTSQGAAQPRRVTSSCPHRWWCQGGAQQGLGTAWLGPLPQCWAQLILLAGGPAAAGALALHLLLILTQWYVCAPV